MQFILHENLSVNMYGWMGKFHPSCLRDCLAQSKNFILSKISSVQFLLFYYYSSYIRIFTLLLEWNLQTNVFQHDGVESFFLSSFLSSLLSFFLSFYLSIFFFYKAFFHHFIFILFPFFSFSFIFPFSFFFLGIFLSHITFFSV